MTAIKVISLLGVVAMTAAILNGFIAGDFGAEGSQLLSMPWGITSLVDLYVGFILFCCWIFYREVSLVKAVVWSILMLTMGFWAGSLYVFIVAQQSQGDWHQFWMGKHA